MSNLAKKTIQVAESYIGVKENPPGSNWGGMVEAFLKSTGLTKPEPWCAAFFYYCVSKAALELGINNPFDSLALKAYTPAYAQWAVQNDNVVKSDGTVPSSVQYEPGNALLIFYAHLRPARIGHIGIIVRQLAPGKVETIEGNTDAAGGRTGGQVMVKTRNVGKRDVVFRFGERVNLNEPDDDHYLSFLRAGWNELTERIPESERAGNPYVIAANRITALVKSDLI